MLCALADTYKKKRKISEEFGRKYGARGGAVGTGTELQAGKMWVPFPMVSLEFFIDIILPFALWPWG